jgi:threonine aldolase
VWPVQANLVFVILPGAVEQRLRAAGARYYVRGSDSLPVGVAIGPGEVLIRLVASFATRESEVDQFVSIARVA